MRKSILLFATALLAFAANAQYVPIPDPEFKALLINKYPASFNAAGLMDTTSNEIITEDSLITFGAYNLEGLQYFKSLAFFRCGSTSPEAGSIPSFPASLKVLEISQFANLTSLPDLPAGLVELTCNLTPLSSLPALPQLLEKITFTQTNISILPALPGSLKFLNCMANVISHIPAIPAGVEFLYCSENPLTSLPDLPAGLIEIDFSNNYIFTDVPIAAVPALPASLKKLNCANRHIRILPDLPAGLQELNCSNNLLSALPTLPSGLKKLVCNSMPLGNLPALPDSLLSLSCVNDSLVNLPGLPPNLIYLYCSNNNLTSLPPFPGTIRWLDCSNNNIFCLPLLPAKVNSPRPPESGNNHVIVVDADKITCIPNNTGHIVFAYVNDVPTTLRSFCSPVNNVNHCQVFPVISGRIFYDYNNNGTRDAQENYKPNVKFSLSNGSIAYSDRDGYFEIGADSLGIYTITPAAPNYYNIIPGSATYNFTTYDTIVSKEYALQANTSKDSLAITITPLNWAARPGFSFPFLINYENAGTTTLSPNVIVTYDDTKLDYDSSSNTAITNNGNNLSLHTGNFMAGQQGRFTAYFRVKTTASLGDSIFTKATINDNATGAADSNKIFIRGSFDPNDKQATPELSPLQVTNGSYIDYTIRFQNTGTDTAFTVVISDTLSEQLLLNTLEVTGSSHLCKTTTKENIVFFEFLNILLPDSNTNEIKSHGFVSFRIKPHPSLPSGETINNKAAIYFDYNAPVITNTAATYIKPFVIVPVQLLSFSAVPQNDNTVSLYWYTANEINTKHFVIETSNDGLRFSAATTVSAKRRTNNNYNAVVADRNTGIIFYRLKMVDNDGSFVYSPIIKIDKRKNAAGFSVLTNPVKNFIIINTTDRSLNNTQASIINMHGAVVKTFIVKEGSQTISITGLLNGVYYVRTTNGSSRIIKQ